MEYIDKHGRKVELGDKISFTLYDGWPNKEAIVRKDKAMNEFGIEGWWPPMMKYLEFEIIERNGEFYGK